MESTHSQLKRILQLALHSPYPGERNKAASLLILRLERDAIKLADLDPSFDADATANTLKCRAGLPYEFEVTLKSREEAQLYEGLLCRYAETSTAWLEGHHLRCVATADIKAKVDQLHRTSLISLQRRLATGQRQAMMEYQERRASLFARAVAEELTEVELQANT